MPETESERSRITWNPKNIFSGTAWYYARYRPGYPDEVFGLLREKFALNQGSRVLDLGCGTGQIAIPMSSSVQEVIAVDPQEEMLQEAQSQAATKGANNIRWLLGESGHLPQMESVIGKVNLTAIARAFHWMDREQTLRDLYPITQSGGGVALVNDSGPRDGPKTPWKETVDRMVKRWLGEERKAGTEGTYSHPKKTYEAILEESPFKGLEMAVIQLERKWSVEQIIGYIYSTSSSSLPVLGDKKGPFEEDIRKSLLELEPSGQFTEPVRIEIMMVWKRES